MHFDEFICKELKSGVPERLLFLFLQRTGPGVAARPVRADSAPLDLDLSFIGLEDRTLGSAANWDYVLVGRLSAASGIPNEDEAGERLQQMSALAGAGDDADLSDYLLFDHSGQLVPREAMQSTR